MCLLQGGAYISSDALKWTSELMDGVFARDAPKGNASSAEQHQANEELRAAFGTFFSRCIAALGAAYEVRVRHSLIDSVGTWHETAAHGTLQHT